MGTKLSGVTERLPSALLSGDFTPISRSDNSKGKVDLFKLVPPEIDLTSAGAVGAKTLTIAPANPNGAAHTNYQISVAAAAGGQDEAINIGYNVGEVNGAEPAMSLTQEIDYSAYARGVAAQRVMEWYAQFAGVAGSNAPRNWFCAFEPGDTASVSGEVGQILYSYIATGFTRYGTQGGGGLSIGMDFNGSAGGAGGPDGQGYLFVDVDGPRAVQMRSCAAIQLLTGAPTLTDSTTTVIPVTSGHGMNVGAKIQIFKPNANGMMTRDWNTGAPVVGIVTAQTATSLTLKGFTNTGLGIASGWGWQLARPTATGFSPAYQFLSVGTSHVSSAPFTLSVAGSVGVAGRLCLAPESYQASLTDFLSSGVFLASPIGLFTQAPSAGGTARRQMITAGNPNRSWSIGFANDTSGDNLDDFIFAVGRGQTDDTQFTIANTALAVFCGDGAALTVGIGGALPSYNTALLKIAAGTTALAQLNLVDGVAKSSPAEGDVWKAGTSVSAYSSGAQILPINVRIGGTTYRLMGVV